MLLKVQSAWLLSHMNKLRVPLNFRVHRNDFMRALVLFTIRRLLTDYRYIAVSPQLALYLCGRLFLAVISMEYCSLCRQEPKHYTATCVEPLSHGLTKGFLHHFLLHDLLLFMRLLSNNPNLNFQLLVYYTVCFLFCT